MNHNVLTKNNFDIEKKVGNVLIFRGRGCGENATAKLESRIDDYDCHDF